MANVLNMSGGGKDPVVQSKSVKSTTSQQTVTAPSGVDGYNPITVEPIKLQKKYGSPIIDSTVYRQVLPDSGYDGLSEVLIAPVTLQEKTVSPSRNVQTVTPDTSGTYPSGGYLGLSKVTVNAATLQSKTATLSTVNSQTIRPDSSYYGLSSVTVPMMNLQSKTVTQSDSQQTVVADTGYDGLSQVIVNAASIVKWWGVPPTNLYRFRLSDTQGITNPGLVIINKFTETTLYNNKLEAAIWCAKSNMGRTIYFYRNDDGTFTRQDGGLSVELDGGTILIELSNTGIATFEVSDYYRIFIVESSIFS